MYKRNGVDAAAAAHLMYMVSLLRNYHDVQGYQARALRSP